MTKGHVYYDSKSFDGDGLLPGASVTDVIITCGLDRRHTYSDAVVTLSSVTQDSVRTQLVELYGYRELARKQLLDSERRIAGSNYTDVMY